MTMQTIINDALAEYWIRDMRSPKAIHIHPSDAIALVRDIFPDAPAPASISRWINGPAGGVSVDVVIDKSVSIGAVKLEVEQDAA